MEVFQGRSEAAQDSTPTGSAWGQNVMLENRWVSSLGHVDGERKDSKMYIGKSAFF